MKPNEQIDELARMFPQFSAFDLGRIYEQMLQAELRKNQK